MEKEKVPKQKHDTSFIDDYFIVKKPEGNMTKAKKKL